MKLRICKKLNFETLRTYGENCGIFCRRGSHVFPKQCAKTNSARDLKNGIKIGRFPLVFSTRVFHSCFQLFNFATFKIVKLETLGIQPSNRAMSPKRRKQFPWQEITRPWRPVGWPQQEMNLRLPHGRVARKPLRRL